MKTFGGFWVSPTKCGRMIYSFDWKDFCHNAEYNPVGKSLYKKFYFCIVQRDENIRDEMNMKMLGWDCDSILIMNPNIILKESFL